MIPAGLLAPARLRAAAFALRVRTVDELERTRDEARARARGLEVERDQLRRIGERAVAERDEVAAKFDRMQKHYELTSRAYGAASADLVAVDRKRAEALAERDQARVLVDRWCREVGTLVDLDPDTTSDTDLLAALKKRFGGGGPTTVLDAWRQVCRLVDSEGFLSPASVVDRVAMAVAQQRTPSVTSVHRPAAEVSREAYDPAMGGDIEPPPGRDEPAVVGCTCPECVVEATIACGELVDGVECGGDDGHAGDCWPSRRALARDALRAAGVGRHKAIVSAQVLDEARLLVDRGRPVDTEERVECGARIPGLVGRCFRPVGHDQHEAVPF